MSDKEKFCKEVTIICDTREQENAHILNDLNGWGVKHISRKIPLGDYSFICNDVDFSLSCAVERKSGINEIWQNITKDRQRFEKEISSMHSLTGTATLILECCPSRDFLKNFTVPDRVMQYQGRKIADVGRYIDSTLMSWSSPNRYNLSVHYMRGRDGTAEFLLAYFYFFYHNYQELLAPLRMNKS